MISLMTAAEAKRAAALAGGLREAIRESPVPLNSQDVLKLYESGAHPLALLVDSVKRQGEEAASVLAKKT